MKRIPLTQGQFALVDDSDYAKLSKHTWHIHKHPHTCYAERSVHLCRIGGKQYTSVIKMHREILGLKPGDLGVDHDNGNGLDNRRKNIKPCTQRENCWNRHELKTSKYPGVSWDKVNKKWVVQIRIGNKNINLGRYINELHAAKVYKKAYQQVRR